MTDRETWPHTRAAWRRLKLALADCWCAYTHGGGRIERDPLGRINWRCAKCGRWSIPVETQAEAAAVAEREAEIARLALINQALRMQRNNARTKLEHRPAEPSDRDAIRAEMLAEVLAEMRKDADALLQATGAVINEYQAEAIQELADALQAKFGGTDGDR